MRKNISELTECLPGILIERGQTLVLSKHSPRTLIFRRLPRGSLRDSSTIVPGILNKYPAPRLNS
jgi:hypothetical protein